MKEMKRILAIFLCLVMLVGVMPVSAFATEDLGGFFIPGGDKAASEDGSLGGFVIPGGKVEAEETTAPAEEETTAPAEEEPAAPSEEETTAPTEEEEESEEETLTEEEVSDEAEQLDADEIISTIIAMSDYQNSSLTSDGKKAVPQSIVDAMFNAGVTPELALIAGDYTDGSVGSDGDDQSQSNLKTELGNLTGILTSKWSNLPYYAIQGNHDYSGFLTDGTLSATGAYEQDNYIIYLINEDDFPWWQGNYGSGSSTTEDKATVTATANNLKAYLDKLDGSKPVIIQTHVPLHWSERSTAANWYYDNIYANILFDVVNEAAKELDILFMFGHNHSSTASGGDYDHEIGGALAYVAVGESMKVPNGTDGTSNYTIETLNFTYMNSGYVGKYAGSTANCSISAITIDSDSIDIARYTNNGSVYNESINLNGGNNEAGTDTEPTTPSVTTGEWVTIPGAEASEGGYEQVTALSDISSNEKYLVVVWRYFGDNPNEEGYVFHDENNGEIKVSTSDGYATITGTNGTIDNGCFWHITNNGNGTVTMKNAGTGYYLGSNIVANSSSAVNLNVSTATYGGYFNMAIGYKDGAIRYSNSSGSFSFSGNSTSNGASSANACNITIYKMAAASEGSDDTYARLTGETVQNYDTSERTSVSAVLDGLTVETSTDGETVSSTVAVTSDMVTWDKAFNGSSIGTYTGTVKYEGQTLGTVTVNVTGSAEEVVGNGDWVQIADGETTYTYTQATSITAGGKYVIVGNDHDMALQGTTSMGTQRVTVDGTDMTSTVKLTEWTFSGSSSGTIYNGTRYLRYSGSSFGLGTSAGSYTLTFTNNGSNFRIQSGNYSFYYNGSSWTRSGRYAAQYVRLYQYKDSDTSDITYARLTGTLEQVYSNADNTTLATVLGKVSIQTSTDQSTVADTVAVTSDMVTWDTTFNGSAAGVYTGTVTYEGKTLGTIKVTVQPISVKNIELSNASGSVIRGSAKNATTGGKLLVTYSDGSTKEVDVTLGMLNNDGKTVGTYPGLTISYGGKTVDGFTLTVNPRAGNNYPAYPDEGAVKVNKTATGLDFQASGTATVELSASGVPMNQGVDVVLVLDTSSSMQETVEGFSSNRLTILRPAVNSLIQQLQTKHEDGSNPDMDIAIVAFNGFTGNGNSSTQYGADNYIQVQAYATPNAGGWLTDESGDGWVDIMDLATNWADENQGNIDTGSGTNYDEGLLMAYELLSAKQDASGSRKQYVIFMSDGAPFQYNGVYSNYTSTEWNNWLLGNYETEDDIPDTVSNKEYYTGYAAGQGQDHRIAEAIKGDPNQTYQIVTTTADTNGTTELETVYGLGATMYAIGYLLADNGQVTNETQDIVLRNIASSDELYFDVDTVDELDNAFTTISDSVKLAAYNARFTDEMGEMYDLQLTPIDYLPTGETTDYSTINPVLEVRSYDIYTRAELEEADGSLTEANAKLVGTRKTYADGSYKYQTLETITFQYTKNGTNDYTLNGATSDKLTSSNILKDGVICGKYFWYNTNKNANASDTSGDRTLDLDGDGEADDVLAAECFYWNIGDINTTELALRYNVHLDGSLAGEGGREAGSYDTNGDAILYYDNYLGNPCTKEALTPTLAWKGANVSYAFYLVDASSGKPVNNDGVEVPFSNRTVIVDRTLYDEILLNNETGVIRPMSIAASGVLPAGYWLYDESASYTVTVNSNGTGNWVITGDSTLKNPSSTYVMDYLGDEFINENCGSSTHPDYDYTHTTVWFAVKWEPQAVPDTVVVDYGLPVDVHVLTNDMFGKYGKLIGVRSMEEGETTEPKKGDAFNTQEAKGTFGNAKLDVPATGYTEANSVITYTMKTMGMYTFERFAYCVQYANPVEDKNDGCYYGYLTVIPATTIYYEDDFVDLSIYNWSGDVETGTWVKYTEGTGWTTDGQKNADATQDEDRPDDVNYAFDTVIDANNVYGYDSSYTECSKYSLGSAAMVNVNYDKKAEASFTFYGTGFDVISLTSNQTGTIIVDVINVETGKSVHSYVVDTYFGYQYIPADKDGEEGKWQITVDANGDNVLYQVPVIKVSGLAYGQYKAVITAQYSPAFDHEQYDNATYDFYLDAIRIYDPAGVVSGEENEVIEDAYSKDNEGWPIYQELRNNVIDAVKLDETTGSIAGIVFVDGVGDTAAVADYETVGPNNELYLKPGQAIMFTMNPAIPDTLASLQIGLKCETGDAASYYIFGTNDIKKASDLDALAAKTLSTGTDMYYDITELKDATIVIYNDSESGDILTVTNLKATFTAESNFTGSLSVIDKAEVEKFLTAINTKDDGTVETTPPTEDGDTGTGSEGVTDKLKEVIKSIVSRLKGLFGKG